MSGFVPVCERRCMFFLFSRKKKGPSQKRSWALQASDDSPRARTCTFEGPRLHPNQREDTQREIKSEMWDWAKKAKFWRSVRHHTTHHTPHTTHHTPHITHHTSHITHTPPHHTTHTTHHTPHHTHHHTTPHTPHTPHQVGRAKRARPTAILNKCGLFPL